MTSHDVVVVGGGHNGLTAAALLARAGLDVLVLERLDHTGGAAVSAQAFPGLPPRLSRYSYLVSLMPEALMAELDLDVRLVSRPVASFTPWSRDGRHDGLLVERPEGPATAASFRELTGSDDAYAAWQRFYADVATVAEAVAPTLLSPLPREQELTAQVAPEVWDALVNAPLGRIVRERFTDDTVRGVVATDGLIGTFADLDSPTLVQNRCFLYHVIGNGTGEWRVPVGGMGAVSAALARAATAAGATLRTSADVRRIEAGADDLEVAWHEEGRLHTARARRVLSGAAPWVLAQLMGTEPPTKPVGAQLKINFLLDRLPRLKSGVDPEVAFAGTLHVAEEFSLLQRAYADAAAGRLPDPMPGELYCHSLTDPSIMDGHPGHTLTYFGLHTPAPLLASPDAKAEAVRRAVAAIDAHLAEPLASCLARDAHGAPCLEAKVPTDVEADLAMPGGHIFHGDLAWPWAADDEPLETPEQQWGVDTGTPGVLLCGSGARRGGAVSGLGGHNAARAVLAQLG